LCFLTRLSHIGPPHVGQSGTGVEVSTLLDSTVPAPCALPNPRALTQLSECFFEPSQAACSSEIATDLSPVNSRTMLPSRLARAALRTFNSKAVPFSSLQKSSEDDRPPSICSTV